MKNKSIYILEAFSPAGDYDVKSGTYDFNVFGAMKLSRERIGVFSSVEKAEETMKTIISENARLNEKYEFESIYCSFEVIELYLDNALYNDGTTYSSFESIRTYLPDGTLNCFSNLDDRCTKDFSGRDEPHKWVKPGEYAFLRSGNELTLIYVDQVALTKDEWKNRFKPGVCGDVTDDSGLAFSADAGHVHPLSTNMFPLSCLPGFVVPEKFKIEIMKQKDEYYA